MDNVEEIRKLAATTPEPFLRMKYMSQADAMEKALSEQAARDRAALAKAADEEAEATPPKDEMTNGSKKAKPWIAGETELAKNAGLASLRKVQLRPLTQEQAQDFSAYPVDEVPTGKQAQYGEGIYLSGGKEYHMDIVVHGTGVLVRAIDDEGEGPNFTLDAPYEEAVKVASSMPSKVSRHQLDKAHFRLEDDGDIEDAAPARLRKAKRGRFAHGEPQDPETDGSFRGEDPDDAIDESTNPSTGWRAPEGAEDMADEVPDEGDSDYSANQQQDTIDLEEEFIRKPYTWEEIPKVKWGDLSVKQKKGIIRLDIIDLSAQKKPLTSNPELEEDTRLVAQRGSKYYLVETGGYDYVRYAVELVGFEPDRPDDVEGRHADTWGDRLADEGSDEDNPKNHKAAPAPLRKRPAR